MRRSWCLGEEPFGKELLARVTERRGACHYLGESQEVEVQKAERMVREQLTRRGWTEAELKHRTKADRHKARIALRLRQQTTMTMEWISRRLHMGTANTLKNTLRLVESRD